MATLKHIDFQVPGWGELQQGPQQRLSYRGEVLADSPLMYLRLGETSGPTAADETGQHDATEDGTLAWGVQGPLALDADTAVNGAGTGGLVVNETGWLPVGSSARTIELWYKPNTGTATFRGIKYGQDAGGARVLFNYTHNELSVAVSNARFGIQGLSLADQWHHTALVFPSGATRCDEFLIYLDGQRLTPSVISGSGATLINTADTALMINQFSSGSANNCVFDEVAIYGGALSDQRILDHYLSGVLVEA
jgi:large repetitive protein